MHEGLIIGPFLAMVVGFVLGLVSLVRALRRRGQPHVEDLRSSWLSPWASAAIYWFIAFFCGVWLLALGAGLASL